MYLWNAAFIRTVQVRKIFKFNIYDILRRFATLAWLSIGKCLVLLLIFIRLVCTIKFYNTLQLFACTV